MSDKHYCPWCGRNMDELENGKIDGHAWYRDDSDYIQNIERSRDFMKKRIERLEQLEQLCRDMYEDMSAAAQPTAEPGYFAIDTTLHDRMEQLGLLEVE